MYSKYTEFELSDHFKNNIHTEFELSDHFKNNMYPEFEFSIIQITFKNLTSTMPASTEANIQHYRSMHTDTHLPEL